MDTPVSSIARYWDHAAADFDNEPDHGLKDAGTRAAWAELLHAWVAADGPRDILDLGCGTGSLSLLLAEAGHRVTGVDLAPRMVDLARRKLAAAGMSGEFRVGDASAPPTGGRLFDVLLSRHLVWTLPDPVSALGEWVARLRPGGTLVLVEGRWREAGQAVMPYTPGAETLPWAGGVPAAELAEAVRPFAAELRIEPLSGRPQLWGGPVADERYALIAKTARRLPDSPGSAE